MSTKQTVDIRSESGGVEYVPAAQNGTGSPGVGGPPGLTITEATGADISGDVIELSLGSYSEPGPWRAPDVDEPGDTSSSRFVQLLIGDSYRPPAGKYYLWSRVGDSPEVIPRNHKHVITILNDDPV